MFKLIVQHWPYLLLSTVAALIYVALNSASIWLTASLINNILMDFDKLISDQARLAGQEILSLNEKLKFWTNGFILRDTPQETLKVLCLSIVAIFLTKNIFLYLKNILMALVQFQLITDLRNRLYEHFNSLSLSYFNQKKSGELTSIIINDVANLQRSISTTFNKLLIEPINILVFTILLFVISWKLTLITLFIIPISGFTIIIIGKSIRRKSKRTAVKIAGITNIITETLSSIRIVKAYVMEKYEISRFKAETKNFYKLLLRRAKLSLVASPLTESIGVLMGVAMLWIGGLEVINGQGLSSEDFLRFILIMFAVLEPLRKLSKVNVELQSGAASAERVFNILDTPPIIFDSKNAINKINFENKIKFDNVSFKYRESNESVLKNINFEIEKGSIVALVGPSGAGKSTVADLILRFYDVTDGNITMDGIDIRNITLGSLRNLMGTVTQETILFNDTIHANIAYGLKDVSVEEIRNAAIAANALDFIEELPEKWNTVVGEKGVMLSGGQRQRIAIARALQKNPPILILDEATSALDTKSERAVQLAIEKLMKDRTVIVIAHRLSTIQNANKIIVLDSGKICEVGTHEELLKLGGHYKTFYNNQFRK